MADNSKDDVLIVGAGAAGLWCAEVAARGGRSVRVLEKTPRTGTKVLASGGTRCNVTTTLGPDDAARLFGTRGERFVRPAFRALPPVAVRERFESWGVPLEEAPLEKVFPSSGNARDVRDALENATRGAGATIELGAPVTTVQRDGDAWLVQTESGAQHRAGTLVLASGGLSYPKTGTTGDGYAWLRGLDLPVVDPVPALVPLASQDSWVTELTGLSWQSGAVTLEDRAGHVLARRERPLLFTHRGVSGPAAMDVSHHVARDRDSAFRLRFDFFPGMTRDELREQFVEAARMAGNPRVQRALGRLTTGPMPRRMFEAVAAEAGVLADVTTGGLSKSMRHAMVETLKGLAIPVRGTLGWDQAEVTAGGLSLKAVNPRTMAVNGAPGLFVIGELLDVNGPIGGLSFQAAFATAELAAAALCGDGG